MNNRYKNTEAYLFSHIRSALALFKKETRRIFRIWPQTLIPPAITATLYFTIFGQVIGKHLNDIQGVSYIQFIIPGLIMLNIILSSYNNVVSSFFSAKFQRSIEELLVSPISYTVIVLGYVAGGVTRGLLNGIIVMFISFMFAQNHIHNIFLVFIVAFFASVLFSLAGLLNAIFAKKFDDISIFPTFILSPLIYLGGVFYSVHLLPTFWRKISFLNPILYIINAFRYAFLGVSDIPIVVALVCTILMIFALFTTCVLLLQKGHGIYNR